MAQHTESVQSPTDLRQGAAWLAGEASGDFLASLVLPRLKTIMQGAPQFGIGGEKMVAAGLDAWYSSERLAVRGYVEVLKKLPGLVALRSAMVRRVAQANPRVFIGVDAPDFNLGIEMKLKARGIPTVHFVSPSIWAWRPERIRTVEAATNHVLLIFPFEEEIYKKAGVPATYIGHPLAGIIPMTPNPAAARAKLGLSVHDEPLFAVLPGSRVDEVSGCGPIFFEACERVVKRLGGCGRFVLPAVDEARRQQILAVAKNYPVFFERLTVTAGQSHLVLESADAVLVASGTAALEAALFKKPMVVGPGLKIGLNIHMDIPSQVGSDLIVAAVAALDGYEAPILLIDMGTATTIQVIEPRNVFIGGVILPGVMLSLDALSSRTAQLPGISLEKPRQIIGKNTIDCMRSGAMYGTAAMIDGIIDRIARELGHSFTVIATGGIAQFIIPLCDHEITLEKDLQLKGLNLIYKKNKR